MKFTMKFMIIILTVIQDIKLLQADRPMLEERACSLLD